MQAVAKWGLENTNNLLHLLPIEYAVWKWVENHDDMVTPTSVARVLRINRETSTKYLKSLVIKGLIIPASKEGKKIMRYRAKSSIKI
jgi:response regulator of citrate/malate metabolism